MTPAAWIILGFVAFIVSRLEDDMLNLKVSLENQLLMLAFFLVVGPVGLFIAILSLLKTAFKGKS